ncbi:hypothetical protein QBC38DRAFT_491960 [Podospora fimiseda]|uniref:Secreted protein n=1 Tax=Podospora fimiseda TaxID=252190 RepID=A0AAN7BGI5_9PEZI|nr:hypothetical protein QBC38DRAFT_491960 [Podospora fimiseda]
MKFFATLASLITLAAAAPAPSALASPQGLNAGVVTPSKVRVVGLSLLGSGCPAGSADVQIDATKTLLEVTFSEYIIQTGPGTKASEWRKNCKLTLNLEFDEGFQFATLATSFAGFAQIPKGARGLCTNTFDFTGVAGSSSYSISLVGQREGPFALSADPDITSWSPCGGTTSIMNMNTQCNISPTQSQALIAVDRISGKLTLNVSLEWRKCK